MFISVVFIKYAGFSQTIELTAPAGTETFGCRALVLTNGNYVIADTSYDEGSNKNVGAVYLYNGNSHDLISKFTGSQTGDLVGIVLTALPNGNFVVHSPFWDNDSIKDAGAFTWVNGDTGITGVVEVDNSMVGNRANDRVGFGGNAYVVPLTNGNYIVNSLSWFNEGGGAFRGAVTFCLGNKPAVGVVGPDNSLVGSKHGDQVGTFGINSVRALSNGNYVVASPVWNGLEGAVTWGSGDTGVRGYVSSSNSLRTGVKDCFYGRGIHPLKNGNFIISSSDWSPSVSSNSYGIVTWCDGSKPTTGIAGPSNSICGRTDWDEIGNNILIFPNDDYLIIGTEWDDGVIEDAGALTWCSGTKMSKGQVDSTNSLVGTKSRDRINGEIEVFPNCDYIVTSPYWDNGSLVDVGAVTYCDSGKALKGRINKSNSLIGSHYNDRIGKVLTNDSNQYIIYSSLWDNGDSTDAGIVFWNNGSILLKGEIDPSNSLIGERKNDKIGYTAKVLRNGNFVAASQYWSNGMVNSVGAATWIDKRKGIKGTVSVSNSLIGLQRTDYVGSIIIPLENGHYVVNSINWNNGSISDAGAVTWCNGVTGKTGYVSQSNSLVGSSVDDRIGFIGGVVPLSNGNYVVGSDYWDNGSIVDAGAATFVDGSKPYSGIISNENSIVGTHIGDKVSRNGIREIGNSNYLVQSSWWDNNEGKRVGALTWCEGSGKSFGEVTEFNSLVGISNGDSVGFMHGFQKLNSVDSQYYYIENRYFDNGTKRDAGFMSIADSKFSLRGKVSICNSFIGELADKGIAINYLYNPFYKYSIITKPLENKVIIYTPDKQELSVFGNKNYVSNGSSFTSIKNNTYFNEANICGNASVRTFYITNQGTKPILIKNKPRLIPLVKNDSAFRIKSITGDTIILGDSMVIQVEFLPLTAGDKKAIIEFVSNDCVSDTFRFSIGGKGVEPNIFVKGNNVSIANGDTSINIGDSTNFGVTENALQRRFEILNNGVGRLNIRDLRIVGKDSMHFKAELFSKQLDEGGKANLDIYYEPTGLQGKRLAAVEIYSNDCADSIYTFTIGVEEKLNSSKVHEMNNGSSVHYKIYPNPTNGYIKIEFDKLAENTSLMVTNLLGQILINKPNVQDTTVMLDLDGIHPGTYLLQVGTGMRKSTTWIIIY